MSWADAVAPTIVTSNGSAKRARNCFIPRPIRYEAPAHQRLRRVRCASNNLRAAMTMHRPTTILALAGLLAAWPAAAVAQSSPGRFELGAQVTSAVLSEFDETDVGVGGRLAWLPAEIIGIEAEINVYPEELIFSRNRVEGLFGVTVGPRFDLIRPFAKLRFGFLRRWRSAEAISVHPDLPSAAVVRAVRRDARGVRPWRRRGGATVAEDIRSRRSWRPPREVPGSGHRSRRHGARRFVLRSRLSIRCWRGIPILATRPLFDSAQSGGFRLRVKLRRTAVALAEAVSLRGHAHAEACALRRNANRSSRTQWAGQRGLSNLTER